MSRRRVVVSGGTGFVGRFIVEALLGEQWELIVAGRTPPEPGFFSRSVQHAPLVLGDPPPFGLFDGVKCFVHAAFDHLPGKYRDGEGGDAEGFRRRNLDGSIALFETAKAAGVGAVVFLSSRAVYGTQPPGSLVTEETTPHPDTLYGEVKLAAEQHLLSMASGDFRPIILRVTGVYGPAGQGRDHKWSGLIRDYIEGREILPRVGTEVYGGDVAEAVCRLLKTDEAGVFNVSDIVLDRRDLLAAVAAAAGSTQPLPAFADASLISIMSTAKLRALGWRPNGRALLEREVRRMVSELKS